MPRETPTDQLWRRSLDPALILDRHLRLREWNPAACRAFGLPEDGGPAAGDEPGLDAVGAHRDRSPLSAALRELLDRDAGDVPAVELEVLLRPPGQRGSWRARAAAWLARGGGHQRLGLVLHPMGPGEAVDALTGLPSREGLDGLLRQELARARRHQRALCLLLLRLWDVDALYRVGRTELADQVMVQVAALVTDGVRGIDHVTRGGRDTFALVLPDTDARGGRVVARRLRALVSEHPWTPEQTAELTPIATAGLAEAGEGVRTAAELLEAAEASLFIAEQRGRDTIGPD